MQSIRSIYKIGPGPSSSHTFGPMMAAKKMMELHPEADSFQVKLYGSLALTGKGHLTDHILEKTFKPRPCSIEFLPLEPVKHPNTMHIDAFKDSQFVGSHEFVSIGGGQIEMDGIAEKKEEDTYELDTMDAIQAYCRKKHLRLDEFVDEMEDKDLDAWLTTIYKAMTASVKRGLKKTGVLPGALKLERVANALHQSSSSTDDPSEARDLALSSYAYAASEENASGGMVVTAPTMGSCGVIPALVYRAMQSGYPKSAILRGLKTAGLVGALVQHNATISGAKAGCQAEVGTAVAMGAAMLASMDNLTNEQIECAAEMGLEHHLGLTCDPVGGYVMIPCIERNAMGALRAVDAARLAKYLRNVKKNRVSLDMVIQTMNMTGSKLPVELKESSLGGLAVVVPNSCPLK